METEITNGYGYVEIMEKMRKYLIGHQKEEEKTMQIRDVYNN